MIDPGLYAAVGFTLFAGHYLGDYASQTDRQASGKSVAGWSGRRALAAHIVGYHLTVALVLTTTATVLSLPLTVAGIAAGATVSTVTHTALDRGPTLRWIMRRSGAAQFADLELRTTTGAPWYPGRHAVDQALHLGSLWLATLLIVTV